MSVIIPLSKQKLGLRIAILLIAVLLCIEAVRRDRWSPVATVLIWAGMGVCTVALIYFLTRLFDTKPGLVINEKGIINNSGFRSSGLIEWDKIKDITTLELRSNKKLIVVDYTTGEGKAADMPIPAAILKIDSAELLEILLKEFKKQKK